MAEQEDLLRALQQEAAAVTRLAEDEEKFRALFDAFRAEDTESFQRLLRELELLDRCELVCSWLCSKECVLVCLELCGRPSEELPDLRQFAEVVVRIASDEELVERLANSVAERDADGFGSLVKELGVEPFCHLLCHWVCTVRCRLVCHVVCGPPPLRRPQLAEELAGTVEPLRRLLENEKLSEAAAEAVRIGDCERLRGIIQEVGLVEFCEIICEWICTWRCIWLCIQFCGPFPIEQIDTSLSEAFEFAKATARLGANPAALERLATAVEAEDAQAFGAAVMESALGRFCIQLCHWLCSLRCRQFCFCVCPPILAPWFTHVGHFDIYADIDGTGKTNKGLVYAGLYFNGGPHFGFQGCLELRGFCPTTSPTSAGVPMRYRFLYEYPAGTRVPVTGGLVCPVDAGTRQIPWPQNLAGAAGPLSVPTFQTVKIDSAPAPDPVPPAVGTPWYGPSEHVITPDPQGWITVDPAAIGGGFTTLIGFKTTQLIPGGDASAVAGVTSGNVVPAANQQIGTDIGIIFEATRVTAPPGPPDFTNSLSRIHINNWGEVNLLNLLEFHTGGGTSCSPLSSALDIEYTSDHELMAEWSVTLVTAATPPPLPGAPVFPSGSDTRGALPAPAPPQPPPPVPPPPPWPWAGTDHYDISLWPTCSYTVWLSTRAGLTTGLIDNQGQSKPLTFCIGGAR